MWLRRDERRMLEGYATLIADINTEKWFHQGDLIPLLSRGVAVTKEEVPEYGETSGHADRPTDPSEFGDRMRAYVKDLGRVELANRLLAARNLIRIERHQNEPGVVGVTLTLSGLDLGQRYGGGFLVWSGLWFEAYRNHWIWLIVGFVGGILGGVLVNLLSS